jgi:hypothetical protein
MKKPTPTNHSMEFLLRKGYTPEIVEHRIPYSFITKDLWGFDILALHPDIPGVLAVQTTSMGHHNLEQRIKKIQALPECGLWLKCKNRIAMHAWGLRGKRGQPKIWTVRIRNLELINGEIVVVPF